MTTDPMTTAAVARRLSISRVHAWRLATSGAFGPVTRPNARLLLVDPEAVERYARGENAA